MQITTYSSCVNIYIEIIIKIIVDLIVEIIVNSRRHGNVLTYRMRDFSAQTDRIQISVVASTTDRVWIWYSLFVTCPRKYDGGHGGRSLVSLRHRAFRDSADRAASAIPFLRNRYSSRYILLPSRLTDAFSLSLPPVGPPGSLPLYISSRTIFNAVISARRMCRARLAESVLSRATQNLSAIIERSRPIYRPRLRSGT